MSNEDIKPEELQGMNAAYELCKIENMVLKEALDDMEKNLINQLTKYGGYDLNMAIKIANNVKSYAIGLNFVSDIFECVKSGQELEAFDRRVERLRLILGDWIKEYMEQLSAQKESENGHG
jgi:hypothetical protein